MYSRLAQLAIRRPWAVLVGTLLLLGLAAFYGRDVTNHLSTGGFSDPGAESSQAARLLARDFPAGQPNLVLLVRAGQGVDAPEVRREGLALTQQLASEPSVTAVTSYWQSSLAALRADNGAAALVLARVHGTDLEVDRIVDGLADRYRGQRGPIEVEVGGSAAVSAELHSTASSDIARAEIVGIPLTAFVLILVFRSFIASLLPLLVGAVAMMGTTASLKVVSHFTAVSVFSLNLATGLSLGLATDYALFIVRRHREALAAGASVPMAVQAALATAGRTVVFSALTVAVAVSTMLLFPMYFLRSFAYAGVLVAVLAALAAVVALPAGLVLLGHRVNAWDVTRLFLRRPRQAPNRQEGWRWRRLANAVMRRPVFFAVVPTLLLLVLGLPFSHVVFGIADDRSLPSGAESHRVTQALRHDFAALPTEGITVVATTTDSGVAANGVGADTVATDVDTYARRISTMDGVARVESATGTYASGQRVRPPSAASAAYIGHGATYLAVSSDADYYTSDTQHLVTQLRALDAPFPVAVGGAAAQLKDSRAALAHRLPLVIGIIAAATLLLVFLLTGGVLVSVKALVMNILSLTATFGLLVWAFQDGGLAGLLGFTPTGWVEVTMLVLLFCVTFGVSMDYEVFILARIREEYVRTGDNRRAVLFGIERNGTLVTAAAVVISLVFVAMGASKVTDMKMFGIGLATAVLLDAFLVRTVLVPALMRLAGDANWWAPYPLRVIHRRFGIDHCSDPVPVVTRPGELVSAAQG